MAEILEPFPEPAGGRVDLLVVAGEHSGDEHAARLVAELRQREPGLVVAALGGPKLAAAGAQLLFDLTASSVVGLVEVLKHYPFFKALFAETLGWIERHRPRAVCFVDYPGFNLRLAAALKERGLSVKGGGAIRMLYYISPQIWAWKAGRRFRMADTLDAMAVIFPFEQECYGDTTLPVEFVGHPFVADDYLAPVRYEPDGPVLLLPGSRRQAVSRIFPVLLAGFRASGEREAVVLYPSDDIRAVLEAAEPGLNVRLVRTEEGERWNVTSGHVGLASSENAPGGRVPPNNAPGGRVPPNNTPGGRVPPNNTPGGRVPPSDAPGGRVPPGRIPPGPIGAAAVLTSSGTMSMHCALAGIPGAIAYRAAALTYVLGRMLLKVPYLGIANLLLKEPMYPEYIQQAATPQALAAELADCLRNPARRERTAEQAARLRQLLHVPTSGSAADWVLAQMP